jgi:predicted nucleotidyltransferase
MDNVPDSIIKKIKLFIKELEKDKLKISKVFLFGSYAKNQANEWSDIDLAIVSDDFTGDRMIDYDRFANAILTIDRSIEPIPYRTIDFSIDNPFVSEIIRTGVRIM